MKLGRGRWEHSLGGWPKEQFFSTPDSHFILSWPTVDFYRPLPSFLFLGRDPRDPDPAFFAQFFPSAPFSWIPLFYPVSTPGSHFQLPSPSSNLIAPMTTSQFFVLPRAGIENPDPALNFGLPIWRAGFFSLTLLFCSLRPSLRRRTKEGKIGRKSQARDLSDPGLRRKNLELGHSSWKWAIPVESGAWGEESR